MTHGTNKCRKCGFIRAFLMMAGPLIAMLYLQPEWAARVAQMLPSSQNIAWGIALAIPALFFMKMRREMSRN